MAEDERQIRAAAEALLSGSINSQRSSITQQSITRTPDIVLSEDLIAGAMQNGRMSNVRRFFCLFVTFDLFLTFLMWLICTMIAGESLETAFENQVVHYHIKTSLFDIVMAAICRFIVLVLFYALLYLNHWIIVALTTATTCAFLIAKVFLFDWSTCSQPVFQVLLILSSFVLAWVEAWFFDIRVLPQETQARNWFRNFTNTERSPLLQGVTTDPRQYNSTDPGTFFTPVDSPDHSDHEEETVRRQGGSRRLSRTSDVLVSRPMPQFSAEHIAECKMKAPTLLRVSHDLLKCQDWQLERILPNDDIISYIDRPKPEGRIFKIEGTVNATASLLINRLFEDVETSPSWNKLIKESIKLKQIDENTDIIYQATGPQGGGIIGARDFVILRHRSRCGEYYISTGMSVPLPLLSNRKDVTRAENGVSCWAAVALPNQENKCRFTCILNTNLKLWIPQRVVNTHLSTALVDFMSYVRQHMDELQK